MSASSRQGTQLHVSKWSGQISLEWSEGWEMLSNTCLLGGSKVSSCMLNLDVAFVPQELLMVRICPIPPLWVINWLLSPVGCFTAPVLLCCHLNNLSLWFVLCFSVNVVLVFTSLCTLRSWYVDLLCPLICLSRYHQCIMCLRPFSHSFWSFHTQAFSSHCPILSALIFLSQNFFKFL